MSDLLLILKHGFVLFLFLSASILPSSSSAGGRSTFFINSMNQPATMSHKEKGEYKRILKVKTNDYGTYDPSPVFVKPPFKLIPN